jgi:hypothetical protein
LYVSNKEELSGTKQKFQKFLTSKKFKIRPKSWRNHVTKNVAISEKIPFLQFLIKNKETTQKF